MGRIPQQHPEARHCSCKPEVRGRRARLVGDSVLQQLAAGPVRVLVADLHVHELVVEVGAVGLRGRARLVAQRIDLSLARHGDSRRHHFVQRRHRVSGAQLAGVLRVVGKVLGVQQAVLVADESVSGGPLRVELDLQLHVLGQREKGAAHLLDQHLPRLQEVVDVVEVAVAVVGDLLHLRVLQIAGSEAQHGQEDARVALLLDQAHHLGVAGCAHVEVAVGRQHDPIVAAVDEVLACSLVSQPNPGASGRAPACLQLLQRGQDLGPLVARRRGQCQPGGPRVHDDCDPIRRPKLLHQQRERLLEQRQLVRVGHRARHVQQEDQVGRRQVLRLHRARVQADPN